MTSGSWEVEVSNAAAEALDETARSMDAEEPGSIARLAVLVFPDNAECCTIGLNVEMFCDPGIAPEGFALVGTALGRVVYGFEELFQGAERGRMVITRDPHTESLVAYISAGPSAAG